MQSVYSAGLMARLRSSLMVCMLAIAALSVGCVTTTDSRFAREADRDEAVNNYVRLATAYLSQGNYDRARDHLERALELDSSDAAALSTKALLYQAEGEPELASETYQRSLRSDPGYTRGRVFYGAFLYNNQQFKEAREQFRMASRDTGYEDRGSVFYNLGRANERLGNVEAAADNYKRAVELRRGDSRALLALSRVLAEAGDWAVASRHYSLLNDMIQRSPKMRHSPESLLVGIRIARHFGDYNRESSLALLLRNEYPDSEEYRQYKALIANDNG